MCFSYKKAGTPDLKMSYEEDESRSESEGPEAILGLFGGKNGKDSFMDRLEKAVSPSTALVSRDRDDNDEGNDNDEEVIFVSWRLGMFVITDSVCRAILDSITQQPQVNLYRLWIVDHWKRTPDDEFARLELPSLHSCFDWPFSTCRAIGFMGFYDGLKWNIASNIVSNMVNYVVALSPKVLNVQIFEKTRHRIAAGCAVVPQMYCQVCHVRGAFHFFLRFVELRSNHLPLQLVSCSGSTCQACSAPTRLERRSL